MKEQIIINKILLSLSRNLSQEETGVILDDAEIFWAISDINVEFNSTWTWLMVQEDLSTFIYYDSLKSTTSVVRVPVYGARGPGSIPSTTRFF
jgi:hypothetical protein